MSKHTNNTNNSTQWIFIALLALILASGCASQQAISNYARSGETIVLSLGGTDSNALVSVLKKNNITVTITDSANVTHTAKLRNVFRLYSDPSSVYNFRSPSSGLHYDSYVTPHQGLWMAVVDLVDPVTDNPLALAVGSATISVSSPDLKPWVDYAGWGWTWTNGNLSSISIEILAGTGSSNPMNYLSPLSIAPLDSLSPEPQVEVTVSGAPSQIVGGGSFVFQIVKADFSYYGNQTLPRVVTTSPDPNVQVAWHRIDQGNGMLLLKVMITNPHGFNVDNGKNGMLSGRSMLRSLRFSIVWDSAYGNITVNDANWQDSIQLVSGEYIGLDGDRLSELAPVLTKVN